MVNLHSAQVIGLDAAIISVEVDISPGLHIFSIVGLADKEIQESRERIGAAIRNIGARPPHKKSDRLIVNLAPADVRKEGPAFDLPIALGFLLASGQARFDPSGKLFLGELGLDGSLKPVSGVLAMALAARRAGINRIYLPAPNAREAALAAGLEAYGSGSIVELLEGLEGRKELTKAVPQPPIQEPPEESHDFALIHGQEAGKRTLEIAAAGAHNVIFHGPPGTGKTLLARCLPAILPELDQEEAVEVTKIASIAGRLQRGGGLLSTRPFRAPHHGASAAAIIGGGPGLRPGEVTMAHRGVLFLDEIAQFQPHVLESLRQPLEDREVFVARAQGSMAFPSDFILVAAMNPCPCGNFGSPRSSCACTPGAVNRYRRRISGALMDRIDLHAEVTDVAADKLDLPAASGGESSAEVKKRVVKAREIQRGRLGPGRTNSTLALAEIKSHCRLDQPSRQALGQAYQRYAMSVRSYYRTIKVARTVADLDGSQEIKNSHVLEALQYRPKLEA